EPKARILPPEKTHGPLPQIPLPNPIPPEADPPDLGAMQNCNDVSFSPDGRRLATIHGFQSPDGKVLYTLAVWDLATGKRLAKFHQADIQHRLTRPAFSPDSGRV